MRIKLIHNPLKHWTAEVKKQLRKHLVSAGHKIVKRDADASVCIGGDGTVLYANYKNLLEGNILGIGSRRSFICQLRQDDWKRRIDKKLQEKTIPLQALGAGAGKTRIRAINDVVVHTTDYRVIGIEVWVGGKRHPFRGDGVIVSSAVGSSSYAYSAGGRRLGPKERRIVVVPIAPYRRMFGPRVVDDGGIKIRCDRKAALIVDGIFVRHLRAGETIRIKKDGLLRFYRGVGFFGRQG